MTRSHGVCSSAAGSRPAKEKQLRAAEAAPLAARAGHGGSAAGHARVCPVPQEQGQALGTCLPKPVVSWAAAQRGHYCDRHLQSGLLSTSCRGDSFCFSKWCNAVNSKRHCTGISLCSSVGVWQLLPPKICLSATVFIFPMGTPSPGPARLLSPRRSCFWP